MSDSICSFDTTAAFSGVLIGLAIGAATALFV